MTDYTIAMDRLALSGVVGQVLLAVENGSTYHIYRDKTCTDRVAVLMPYEDFRRLTT